MKQRRSYQIHSLAQKYVSNAVFAQIPDVNQGMKDLRNMRNIEFSCGRPCDNQPISCLASQYSFEKFICFVL